MVFKVKIVSEGLTDIEQYLVKQASDKIVYVINSDKFKEWCLNFKWSEQICTGSLWWKKCRVEERKYFHYNEELTNFQVYNKIMDGKEVLSSDGVDNEADIFLKVDRSNKRSVVGYTYANSIWQWTYNWVFMEWTADDIAGNLAHEYCHKLGFNHEFNRSYARQFSVPYSVGYYVAKF